MWNFIARWRLLIAVLLLALYGGCLRLLQTLAPELVGVSLWLSLIIVLVAVGGRLWISRRSWAGYPRQVFGWLRGFYVTGADLLPAPAARTPMLAVVISAALCTGIGFVILVVLVLPQLGLLLAVPLAAMVFFAAKSGLDPLLLPRRLLIHLRRLPMLSADLPPIARGLLALEMGLILVTTLLITRPFYDSPPTWQLSGNESEWLTSTVATAYTGLHDTGRIPRWQPYLENGEPVIENPFNFIFNPFASAPSLLLGPVIGLRVSVIIGYCLAGLGGWFLGRVLGLGALGRVLLALLLMGKGNLHTMLNSGYYQLALSQIYMPYVIGGVFAVFRWPRRRWPVVWTGLALALQFLSGNIWYVLPTAVGAICTGGLLLAGERQHPFDWRALKRLLLAAVIAVGLSAVVALPVTLQFKQLGRHPNEVNGGWSASLSQILPLFINPDPDQTLSVFVPAAGPVVYDYSLRRLDEFYYTYIIPGWYLLLIVVALPLYRPARRREQHIGWLALILAVLATLWGVGSQQPILFLYDHLPLLAQWRYVGRALAVATFWMALLLALRIDNLWGYVFAADWAALLKLPSGWIKRLPRGIGALLIIATLAAGAQVNDQWYKIDHIVNPINPAVNRCITWLRQQHPGDFLSVWQPRYNDITTFLNNHVRTWQVAADFEMTPQASTVGSPHLDLNAVRPRYALAFYDFEALAPLNDSYAVMLDSPPTPELPHCLYQRDDTLPYAYTVTRTALDAMNAPDDAPVVDVLAFKPVMQVERRTDQVALLVMGSRAEPTFAGVQERAYPGWRVEVNGQAAPLESIGGQIGVLLPGGDAPVQVYFVYEPLLPVIGGLITLLTACGCAGYLLTGRRRSPLGVY